MNDLTVTKIYVFLRTNSRTISGYSLGFQILEGAIGQARYRIRAAPLTKAVRWCDRRGDEPPALDQLSNGSRRHNADKVSDILGAKLFHDPGSVNFDSPEADAELTASFLARGACRDLGEHLAFAGRQVRRRKIQTCVAVATPGTGCLHLAYARDRRLRIERLLYDIDSAVLDSLHRRRESAHAAGGEESAPEDGRYRQGLLGATIAKRRNVMAARNVDDE
jgi:hypothetical protein